jgi:adenylate kinase family enzyme
MVLMKRVMIVGGPGSGKSTLARLLGERTGLPVVHIDHIHWQAGWIERDKEDKDRLTREVHARDAWIFEGGHSRTYDDRMARADTLIWLDMPVWLRLWRVLRRTVAHLGQSRPDLTDGCPEVLGRQTLEFIAFIWRTRRSSHQRIEAIASNPPTHLTVRHLRSLAEVRAFLDGSRALAVSR